MNKVGRHIIISDCFIRRFVTSIGQIKSTNLSLESSLLKQPQKTCGAKI